MSFSSFSTSILYDEKTVHSERHEAVETGGPGRRNHPDNSPPSYLQDPSRFPHALHQIAQRNSKPENKTSVPGKPSNDTKGDPALNATAKSLVKDWKYDKASIAASSIFGALAIAALILLCVSMAKKIRRRQRRKREGDLDSLNERRRRRESMMFSKCTSARSYMVEEQKDGKVVRVFCTNHNRPRTSTIGVPTQKNKSLLRLKPEASCQFDDLNASDRGRSGSIPKQIVVVPSPLRTVVSRSAIPDSPPAERTERAEPPAASEQTVPPTPTTSPTLDFSELDQDTTETSELTVPRTPATSPTLEFPELDQDTTEAELTSCPSHRISLLRLPSIRRSMSPFFGF
ncbi:hypothetical protein BJX76DRAFT_360315 [Aspergillus varians]